MSSASKIFTGYRAVGFISNHVPLAVRYNKKHQENYVVTCVGRAFHIYNCSKLGLVSISNLHPDSITCLAVDERFVFTACGCEVRAFTHGRQALYTYSGHNADVHLLLVLGKHLVSVDTDGCAKVWEINTQEVYLEMKFSPKVFYLTAIMHPSTYLNKILLGSKQGGLQLWNIKTDKLIYAFPGWNSAVTVFEQSPAIDVIAIGLADGHIYLHNLKFDETVMKFIQDWGPVTTISFRTDDNPVMATGSSAGHIALWDLEERKLRSQMRAAHDSAVSGMKCLPNQPLMVTSSSDNSVKVWIFDQPDGGGRLLRQRAGHSAPPIVLRHYDQKGQSILSAGQDSSLRVFSAVHDSHNKSLGRASFNKAESKRSGLKNDQHMMPPITAMAAEPSRQSDWDNIVACHRGLGMVTTWSYQRSTMGHHKFHHERFTSNVAKFTNLTAECVAITSCGNFALIGYSSGHVDTYNLQSGQHRGAYGSPTAHTCAVRAVVTDGLNQVTVTAGAKGQVKFWKFKSKALMGSLTLESSASRAVLYRESSLLAISLDDFSIVIIDIDMRRVIREFSGHSNRITDMSFSPDGRWLITASMDSTVRTWDLPTGRLVDCFLLDSAVTSLSMSPTGDFLTTSHVDDVGVYLWSNKTLFSHVSLCPLKDDFMPTLLEMPSTSKKSKAALSDEESDSDDEEDDYNMSNFVSPDQISEDLITLSLLATSRWRNLLDLDIIKERNKPKMPPKVSKSAPFFLPTIPGLQPKFVAPDKDSEDMKSPQVVPDIGQPLSELGDLLQQGSISLDYDDVLQRMKSLGPSLLEVEFQSLAPDGGGSVSLMCIFMKFINHILQTRTNFELAQAYLGLFLKLHGEQLTSHTDVVQELQALVDQHTETWQRLQKGFCKSLCLINYLRLATL